MSGERSSASPLPRVMVVDDNAMNRELLDQELQDLGFEVLAVDGGRACLERMDWGPHVVLLDIQMPDMNGLEVLDALRAAHSPTELPIIMATALSSSEDVVGALGRGANDYVTKPIDIPVLEARLRTALATREAARVSAPTTDLDLGGGAARELERCCAHCVTAVDSDQAGCPGCGAARPSAGWSEIDRGAHAWLGQVIAGRFLLDRYLDGGGQGQVYRATGLALGRHFAAKVVELGHPRLSDDKAMLREQLIQEVEAMTPLRSPHVVQIYEVVQLGPDTYAIVMDWVGGITLTRRIEASGPADPVDALRILRQIALGLHELHRHQMVHRDVKPANIMVEPIQGGGLFAKLLDFGIASRTRTEDDRGLFLGSVHFAAPEQIRGDGIDGRADLYALGCTLYYMLSGERPFQGERDDAVLRLQLVEPLPRLPEGAWSSAGLRADFDRLIAELTSKRVADRPGTIPEVLARVDALLEVCVAKPTPSTAEFELFERVGSGGFGEVYRAWMNREGGVRLEVAVKLLRPTYSSDHHAAARMRDEGHLLASLNHPAILKIHELTRLDNRVALVTEFVDGQDLSTCIRHTPPLPHRAALEVVEQIAGAMAAAWETVEPSTGQPLHLIHRDIKPSNIRIGRHGDVKLLDFGISKAEGMDRESVTGGRVIGSHATMAPERWMGEATVAGDVFSLGCVLFECLGRESLTAGLRGVQLAYTMSQLDRAEALIAERIAGLPSELGSGALDLLRSMLAVEPEDRPTPAEVARKADALVEATPGKSLRQWCRDHDIMAPVPASEELGAGGLLATRELSTTVGVETLDVTSPVAPPPTWGRWMLVLVGVGVIAALTAAWLL